MADITMGSPLVKPKLGLMGASMNAMALIAPGAFLWITYQLQAAATAPFTASSANTKFPAPLPTTRFTLVAPGLPLPVAKMSTPCARATR